MDHSGIQTTPNAVPGAKPKPRPRRTNPVMMCLNAVASLRLTVVLFVFAFALVFLGTLAQVDAGNWTVVKQYFRSFFVWVPYLTLVRFGQVFLYFPKDMDVPGSFLFPGGRLLGCLLMANLLAAHATRFKFIWKRSGVLILHAGLIIMMLSEVSTSLFAVEGNMTIVASGSSNYVEVHNTVELAFVTPADSKTDDIVVVPEAMLRKGGRISSDELPVDVEVVRYLANSKLSKEPPPRDRNTATAGFGLESEAIEQKEGSGVETEQKIDTPSAYVTLYSKQDGKSLGTYLVSLRLKDQPILIDSKPYEISLRFKRAYKPYTIYLKEFHHDVYIGTDKPKNYSSVIQVIDPSRQEDREVTISMNNPLWYGGETFYQQGFLEGDTGTILQVVRNPSWFLPYLSCAMVAAGMLVHFGIYLLNFLNRRIAT
jgi:hypothetical protein